MYALYALENAVVAAADQTATDWQRSHHRKADLASQLHAANGLPDVSTLLRHLNELRKAHAYGETTPPSSVTAESIAVLTEDYIEAVASLLGGKAVKPPTIDLEERRYIRSLLREEENGQPTAVVLVGSWARGTQTEPTSDLDLLVVGSPHSSSPVGRIQVIRRSVDQFRRLALGGDDFAQWALRYGKPVKGRQVWAVLKRELLDLAPWPNVKSKLDLATRRCRAAQDLLQMGDLDAADEEARLPFHI